MTIEDMEKYINKGVLVIAQLDQIIERWRLTQVNHQYLILTFGRVKNIRTGETIMHH